MNKTKKLNLHILLASVLVFATASFVGNAGLAYIQDVPGGAIRDLRAASIVCFFALVFIAAVVTLTILVLVLYLKKRGA